MPLDRRLAFTLDTDTAPEAVPNGRAAVLRNLRPDGRQLVTLRGQRALPVALPAGTNRTVAEAALPGTRGGLVWLVWNSNGLHSVVRQLPPAAPQVLLTWAGLRLPAPGPATYLAPTVLDNFLHYLDAQGETRCLPLARLAAGEFTAPRLAAEPYGLHRLKVPPTMPLDPVRLEQGGPDPRSNLKLVQQKAWQFTYRWHYEDGELTVLAPFSPWLDILDDPATTRQNSIYMTLPVPPLGVQAIDVLVRNPGDAGWRIADTLDRPAAGVAYQEYNFSGLSTGGVVQGDDATRPFESLWPAKALAAADDRLWYGRPTIGYPTPAPAFTVTVENGAGPSFRAVPTFHENSPHRVAVQFYDALGRSAGVSKPATVFIPKQVVGAPVARSIRVSFTTTDPAALNAEIPAWATEVALMPATNDRTRYFLQGQAADAHAYLGNQRARVDGVDTDTPVLKDVTATKHEKVWVDIGNFAAAGQGYVWPGPASGAVLRFIREDKEFSITGQYGDYLEVQWSGYPDQSVIGGNTLPLIEIFEPNTTPGQVFYERGPRIPIVRTQTPDGEQRSYGQSSVLLTGDCFLASLTFSVLLKGEAYYEPPSKKTYVDSPTPTVLEMMVPPRRLVATTTTTNVSRSLSPFAALLPDSPLAAITSTTANVAARGADRLLWLDISYGGRPGVLIPKALQQVTLDDVIGWSGTRVPGSLLNGLGTWLAGDQRALAQEQGAIQALAAAGTVASEARLLVAVCAEGATSIGIGVAQVRQADGGAITADSGQVVGYVNSLDGELGTSHPNSVRARGRRVYWWCQDQGEACRYAGDGVNGLHSQYDCRALGQQLAATYAEATVAAAFDNFTKEYVLLFGAVGEAPARTVRFSERAPGFVGDADFTPEALTGAGRGRLVSLVDGQAWEHVEDAPRNTFGGVAYPARVGVWANASGNYSKTWLAVEVESGAERWDLVSAETPSGQRTRWLTSQLARLEDRWHAPLLLDETSPGFTGPGAARRALYEGVPVQGLALQLILQCTSTAPTVRLLAVGLDYYLNGGQSAPQ